MIDAGLIKIIKSKKNITDKDFIDELFNDLQLPIEVDEIRKRINALIQREFIQKEVVNNKIIYHYIS